MADISFANTDYDLGRRKALSAYQLGMGDIDRRLGNVAARATRSFNDLSRAYKQAAPQQITQFTGRGLGRSGLFRQSMADFAKQQERDRSRIQSQQMDEEAALGLEQQKYEMALNEELARLENERQKQIAADAAALKEFAPLTGLFI